MNYSIQPETFVPPVSFETMNLNNLNGYSTNTLINEINKFSNLNASPPIFYNPITQNISYSDPTPKSNIPNGTYTGDFLIWNPNLLPSGGWSISSEKVKLGKNAGENNQGQNCVAIGELSGNTDQKLEAVALGKSAGFQNQGDQSLSIGTQAGYENQGYLSVALGWQSGYSNQGNQSLAIGTQSGFLNQGDGSVGIGANSGGENQGDYSTAINASSGQFNQGNQAIAIGFAAGQDEQKDSSIAIGTQAAQLNQGNQAIAIGNSAGYDNQGIDCVAIGNSAGFQNQHNNTIVISADGALNTNNTNSLYISPIRNDNDPTFNTLTYDTLNKEVCVNTTKTFVIQHPEYESKYLVHACLEGTEAGVYYRGNSYTDDYHKEANKFYKRIELPSYCKFWTDFSVQITPITDSIFDECPLMSSSKVNLCSSNNPYFLVSSNVSTNFDWLVNAKRNNIIVEPEKSLVEVIGDINNPYKYIK